MKNWSFLLRGIALIFGNMGELISFVFGKATESFKVGKCQLAFSESQQQLGNSSNETLFPKVKYVFS